jgi:hypothetical protein
MFLQKKSTILIGNVDGMTSGAFGTVFFKKIN